MNVSLKKEKKWAYPENSFYEWTDNNICVNKKGRKREQGLR